MPFESTYTRRPALALIVDEVVLLDVALGLEHLGDLELELRGRHGDMFVARQVGVPDSG